MGLVIKKERYESNRDTKKPPSFFKIEGKGVEKSFIDTRKLFDYKIPSYEQMVAEMTNLIRSNKVLYSKYTV